MTTRHDRTVKLRVQDIFTGSPDIDPFVMDVSVVDGVVRLKGLVGSFAERLCAAELAAGVVGSRNVRNDIEVDHHVVTLRGVLPSARDRAEARHAVEAVRGVDFVNNRIAVSAPPPTRTRTRP